MDLLVTRSQRGYACATAKSVEKRYVLDMGQNTRVSCLGIWKSLKFSIRGSFSALVVLKRVPKKSQQKTCERGIFWSEKCMIRCILVLIRVYLCRSLKGCVFFSNVKSWKGSNFEINFRTWVPTLNPSDGTISITVKVKVDVSQMSASPSPLITFVWTYQYAPCHWNRAFPCHASRVARVYYPS
jgi:hypothetical protein